MGDTTRGSTKYELAGGRHGIITRPELLALGVSPKAVKHRVATGRLHPIYRGVYAIGRRELTQEGEWMAAVLACADDAALSHHSAAALWGILEYDGPIQVSVPRSCALDDPRLRVHERATLPPEITIVNSIPVTQPLFTLVDLAASLSRNRLEAAVNEADRLGLVDAGTLREQLESVPRRRGLGVLKKLAEAPAFVGTDSDLERRFLALVEQAGLPRPETQVEVTGFRVDFYWPQFRLVVETDGLTYHRTPAQQARDRLRDQAHVAAGLTPLRFTNAQVRREPAHVTRTLVAVIRRAQR